MALTQQCGFLSVTYFIKILNSDELWQFINNYKVHDLSVDKSQKIRKQSRKKLLLISSYINTSGNGEQQVYLDHFSYANYMLLSANTRQKYSLKNCRECQTTHSEILQYMRVNKPQHPGERSCSLHTLLEKTLQNLIRSESVELGKAIAKGFDTKKAQTPHNLTMGEILKRKASRINDVSKKVRREIIKQARGSVKEILIDTDFVQQLDSLNTFIKTFIKKIKRKN